MRKIASFLFALAVLAVLSSSAGAATGEGHRTVFATQSQSLTAELFAARGDGQRPAVVILHGVSGFDAFPAFYRRYAAALADAGIDAYVLSYYDETDAVAGKSKIADERRALFNRRIRAWASSVGEVVGLIAAQARSTGRVGVLGFSQGGFLATAAAAQDPRISPLVVFYGGIPSLLKNEITRLPPLLELHGDADRVVALADGLALVDLARGLGQPVENVVYPGAGHGFDGEDAADARRRTLEFFVQGLLKAPAK